MISFNLRSSLAIALICFVLGFCASFLLLGGCNKDSSDKSFISPKVLKQQADSIKVSYQAKITHLESKNQELQKELSTIKTQLDAAKTKTKKSATTIKKMIGPKGYPAKELLKKVNQPTVEMDNSLSPCDSLAEEVSEYIHDTEFKDSLYEARISIQDNVINVKDSVISASTKQFEKLSMVFDQSIHEQIKLASEYKQLRKQVKWQKRKGKLLAFGTAILSGLATHYLSQ
ncbi:MAG: hypothetical protein ABI688_02515 [Bacteroidota bacterium]